MTVRMAGANSAVQKYPTQYQKNGFELQLLREKSDDRLRHIFHQHFSVNPATLYKELDSSIHRRALNKLKRKGVLKQDQYNLIYPQNRLTDSNTFDATLLFLLIRTLCGYQEPRTGWNNVPDSTNVTLIADGIRLKIGRNRIQHLPLSISRTEYKSLYNNLRDPLIRLGCPKMEIDILMPSLVYNVPLANPNFVGRNPELSAIHQSLLKNTKAATVIQGFPGVGKTESATQYCLDNHSIRCLSTPGDMEN